MLKSLFSKPAVSLPLTAFLGLAASSLSTTSVAAPVASPQSAAPQAVGLRGTMPNLDKVDIESRNVYDYTFVTAPTDWRVQSGVWEMTNRWSCSPQWSWFGGRSEEIAAVWNKRRFQGDVSIHFYFAFKMGLAGTPRWNYHPSDVAVSFNGDGKNLNSGYSFIVGANNNQHSVLLRAGQPVAESREAAALLPTLADGNPATNSLHRHWWYVRVNKIGQRVECWLDDKLLFTYNDPKPLDAGQIALWTYNNGIMLSRVQVYYEKELKPTRGKTTAPAPVKPTAPSPTTLARR